MNFQILEYSMKTIFTTLLLTVTIFSPVKAEPSKPLAMMINTSTSLFDSFMYRLYDQAKCSQIFFGRRNKSSIIGPCMTGIKYVFDDNIIKMTFGISGQDEWMKGFEDLSDTKKSTVFFEILESIVDVVGLPPDSSGEEPLGMIKHTPIRYGWSDERIDENQVRAEIASRTEIILSHTASTYRYKAVRTHHGKVRFEISGATLDIENGRLKYEPELIYEQTK